MLVIFTDDVDISNSAEYEKIGSTGIKTTNVNHVICKINIHRISLCSITTYHCIEENKSIRNHLLIHIAINSEEYAHPEVSMNIGKIQDVLKERLIQ